MGGSVFKHPGSDGAPALHVPRMSPPTYFKLRDHYQTILQALFKEVVCPKEAPGKQDYGDIDFIVYGASRVAGCSIEEIAKALGAIRFEQTSGASTKSFAVTQNNSTEEATEETPQAFAQIDIKVVGSAETLRWQEFKSSYGDLWGVLGKIIRPFGLTADDVGLHVRVKELEEEGLGRRATRMLLTSDADVTMDFLGLDVRKYKTGFTNETEIFNWITSTYLFLPANYGQSWNHDDRQRSKKRPMIRRFEDCYLQNLTNSKEESEVSQDTAPSRQSVLQSALETFTLRDIYNTKLESFRQRQRAQELRKRLACKLSATFSKKEVKLILHAWSNHSMANQSALGYGNHNSGSDLVTEEKAAVEWVRGNLNEILPSGELPADRL